MWTRRQFLSRSSLGVLGASGIALGFQGDQAGRPGALPDGSASRGMVTSQADDAIRKGLAYLAEHCDGGSFGSRMNYRGHVAVASLAGLAFMAGGNQPQRGKYGSVVTAALRHVLKLSVEEGQLNAGFLYNPRASLHGPMYGHGFGTLFLAEAHGTVHDEELHRELSKKLGLALKLIERSQNDEGGWRYQPNSRDADLSVTVCQMVALRAARNAGFAVSKETVDRCVAYVKRSQEADGSFRYMNGRHQNGPPDPLARAGAGLSALFSAGIYEGPEIERGLKFLLTRKPGGDNSRFQQNGMQYFYGHYYAAQAMWTAGGRWWAEWFPAIREELLGRQNGDGSWDDAIDPHYATAMACIILQIPNNYLPILQK